MERTILLFQSNNIQRYVTSTGKYHFPRILKYYTILLILNVIIRFFVNFSNGINAEKNES